MDDLTYNYYAHSNRLSYVRDKIPAGNYSIDLDSQFVNNYRYDGIGNLVRDSAEGITRIAWTVYGKIDSIYKAGGTLISYRYDAAGNRILKKVNNTETLYVRDATGNVMSTYTNDSTGLWQSEINLYACPAACRRGSTRIGIHKYALNLTVPDPIPIITIGNITGKKSIFERGNKLFELTNHLGNVNVVVSDRKKPVPNTGNPLLLSKYMPVVVSAQDYYPFGMIMPERSFSSESYRYGFNGKEMDNEVSGSGNQYDYGFRIYNPRLGRFLSTDPLFKTYPELTPYQFASNSPIEAIDLDGLEAESSKKEGFWKSFGKSVLNGIGSGISYVANNPNHAGYGGGTLPSTGKPPTQADFKRYEVNWSQQLNPTWQIQKFSENLVYGTTNFIGGIIDGDGERTAQAIPPLLGSVGTIAGVRGLAAASTPMTVTKGMSLAAKMDVRLSFVEAKYASALKKYGPDHIDFTKSVSEVELSGTGSGNSKLVQWRDPSNPNASPFFTYDGVDPGTLGIPKTYTQKYFVELSGEHTFLQTTANKVNAFSSKDPGINGTYEGGGIQLYSPEAAKTAKFTPANQ